MLATISGGSFAAGDLFDDDYTDCPTSVRFREGQISELTVTRDGSDADHVNVAWTVTKAGTWGLGPNAFQTNLVARLKDSTGVKTKMMALATDKVTFEDIALGEEVTVELAIVTEHPGGKYLISNILQATLLQSLARPSFSSGVWEITAIDDVLTTTVNEFKTAPVGNGNHFNKDVFYYVGYNEVFANYYLTGANSVPQTDRLRIGVRHGTPEPASLDDVDFNAYMIRLEDENGDVIQEGNDVIAVASGSHYDDGDSTTIGEGISYYVTQPSASLVWSNVRLNDGGRITAAYHDVVVSNKLYASSSESDVRPHFILCHLQL